MPTPIQILVRGLALCYVKDDRWNVHFVCDDNHPLDFIDPSGPQSSIKQSGQIVEGEFSGDFDATSSSVVHPPELFNRNGGDAHNRRLRFLDRNCYVTSKVLVKLPPSLIEVVGESRLHNVQEVGAATHPVAVAKMAVVLRFNSVLRSGSMRVKIGTYDKTFADNGTPLKFAFNNACTNCRGNDSLHLYDIVIDGEPGAERRFVTGELDHTNNVPDHNASFDCPEHEDVSKAPILTYPHGNCDPEGSDPLPLP